MNRVAVALLLLVAAALGVAGLLAATASPAAADHGGKSNYTVIPYDRGPGTQDATYQQHATAPMTFEYLDYIGATWHAGGFTGCGATNTEVFGIDRGDTHSGTRVDEDLTQYVEEADVGEDRFEANFYEEDDAIGTSTSLREGDEFVSVVTDCFDNPDAPGWYQIHSDIGGTAPNGTYIEATDVSHYFYVCECENEREAREQLGPPPSESTPTTTPTATAEPTPTRTPPEEGTPLPSPTSTPTPARTTATVTDATDAAGEAVATATESGGSRDGGSETDSDDGNGSSSASASTPSPTPENWSNYTRQTPTVGRGPGLGPTVAVAALAAVALLAART